MRSLLITGAGPGGLFLAYRVAKLHNDGLKIHVLERKVEGNHPNKNIIFLHAAALDKLPEDVLKEAMYLRHPPYRVQAKTIALGVAYADREESVRYAGAYLPMPRLIKMLIRCIREEAPHVQLLFNCNETVLSGKTLEQYILDHGFDTVAVAEGTAFHENHSNPRSAHSLLKIRLRLDRDPTCTSYGLYLAADQKSGARLQTVWDKDTMASYGGNKKELKKTQHETRFFEYYSPDRKHRQLYLAYRLTPSEWETLRAGNLHKRTLMRYAKILPQRSARMAWLTDGGLNNIDEQWRAIVVVVERITLHHHVISPEELKDRVKDQIKHMYVLGDAYHTADYFSGWGASGALIQAKALAAHLHGTLKLEAYRRFVHYLHLDIADGFFASMPKEKPPREKGKPPKDREKPKNDKSKTPKEKEKPPGDNKKPAKPPKDKKPINVL